MSEKLIVYSNGRCVVVRREGGLYVYKFLGMDWEVVSIFDADELQDAIECANYFDV